MAKRQTLLEDEFVIPKIEWDMHISKSRHQWDFRPWPFDQRPARIKIFHVIVLLEKIVQYIELLA